MALRVTSLSLVLGCAAQDHHGRGGPDVMREFEIDNKEDSNDASVFAFQPFSASYVQKALSEGVDWTSDRRGIVTPVKDQGPHPYCGTFARVAAAEGQYAMHSGSPSRSLSVEQLVDCVGWLNDQMPSICGQPGLMTSEDYGYDLSKYDEGTNPPVPGHPCAFDASKVVPRYGRNIIGQTSAGQNGEDQAAAFIHHNGPVSCGINADVFNSVDNDFFVTQDGCKGVDARINHSVTCVGFGVDPVKGPYWKIKNSWGMRWGDHGFLKVARGVKCGGLGVVFGPMPVYNDISGYYEASEETAV